MTKVYYSHQSADQVIPARHDWLVVATCLSLFNTLPQTALSQYDPPTLEYLVGSSSLIAVGIPGQPSIQRSASNLIITVWPFTIEECWYQEPLIAELDSICVYSPGGVDPITREGFYIPHDVSYVPGARTLAFLSAWTIAGDRHRDYLRAVAEAWSVGLVSETGVLHGGVFAGDSLQSLQDRVSMIVAAKCPSTVFRSSAAVLEVTIGESEALRTKAGVKTLVHVLTEFKGNVGRTVSIVNARTDPAFVGLHDANLQDLADLRAIVFLTYDGADWTIQRGTDGLFGIDPDDGVFATLFPSYPQWRRYIGLTRDEFIEQLVKEKHKP